MKNVLIFLKFDIPAWNINESQLQRLRDGLDGFDIINCLNEQDFLKDLPSAEIAIVWKFKREWYPKAEKLKIIFTPSAGREWIEKSPSDSIKYIHGSFHGRIMAESLMSMALYFNRRIERSLMLKRERKWDRRFLDDAVTLTSQCAMIVGYGNIGRDCARLLKAFGCRVVGVKRDTSIADKYADRIISFDDIESELPQTDHIIFVLPSDTQTDNIFTRRHFDMLKRGAFLYNIGRGNCCKESDILYALNNGILGGAGLDVFAQEPLPVHSPLWDFPNVIITPHSSAIALEYLDFFIDEILNYFGRKK
jgi:phosphoglycerate dehydrogenase-like enzyme